MDCAPREIEFLNRVRRVSVNQPQRIVAAASGVLGNPYGLANRRNAACIQRRFRVHNERAEQKDKTVLPFIDHAMGGPGKTTSCASLKDRAAISP